MNPLSILTGVTRRAVANRLFFLAVLLLVASFALTITSRSRAQKQGLDAPFDAKFKHEEKLRPTTIPGEILVRFRSGATATKRARTSLRVQVSGRDMTVEVQRFGGSEIVEGLRLARVNAVDTGAAIDALRARADVEYAEPNLVRHAFRLPNDPRFPQMWGLKNTGQPSTSQGNPGSPGMRARQLSFNGVRVSDLGRISAKIWHKHQSHKRRLRAVEAGTNLIENRRHEGDNIIKAHSRQGTVADCEFQLRMIVQSSQTQM